MIPDSVISIGDYAFYDCIGLTSVTIPNSVTSIGTGAFSGCSGLTSVILGNSVQRIGYEVFKNCTRLNFITIPNSVTSIGTGAFSGCCSLTSVTIPDSVTSIGNSAFQGCSGLTSFAIPNSVTSIEDYAFLNCTGLTSVTISNSVTSIGSSSFSGCMLENILLKSNIPPTLIKDGFTNQTYYHGMLYVPTDCWKTYAYDDNWYLFHNIRETATTEEQVAMQQAYTLMDAETFTYSVYDPVNNGIGTISSVGINEDNPNHSWQVITDGSRQYLYNLGAKKFATNGADGRLVLTAEPTPIDMKNGDNGIVLGSQAARQWALVGNDRLSVEQDIITGIDKITNTQQGESTSYDLQGRRIGKPQEGVNIIRNADGTTKMVLIKH